MVEHIRALGIVSLLRSFVELCLGVYLIAVAIVWRTMLFSFEEPAGGLQGFLDRLVFLKGEPQPGDREIFLIAGIVLVVLFLVRLLQSICSLLTKEWARKAGLCLAVIDFATPITLPMAFWSLVVYGHPESRDYFRRYGRRE